MPKIVVIVAGKKPCSQCKQLLPIEAFTKDRGNKSGLAGPCCGCQKAKRDKAEADGLCPLCCKRVPLPDRTYCEHCYQIKRNMRERRKARGICMACTKPATKGYTRCDYHREKAQALKSLGTKRSVLSQEDRNRLMFRQNSTCPICLKPLVDNIAVDHCHTTGKIRGLVHSVPCNVQILTVAEHYNQDFYRALDYLSSEIQ